MSEEVELLRKTISASDIKRVAIVDDAFDVPEISPDDLGAVLDFLLHGEGVRAGAQIGQAVWLAGIADVQGAEHNSSNLSEVTEKLYEMYVNTGRAEYDPAGVFARARDSNLQYLRPLLALLGSCDSLVIRKFGSKTPAMGDDELPDLVLVDLFLNPGISPQELPEGAVAQAAADESLRRVRPLLEKDPAVILMSSHGERGKREADSYRARLNDRVYASRFGFVDKGHIKTHPDLGVTVDVPARDTLLDVFQTYKFGKALSEAMTRWLAGAQDGIDAIGKDIRSLQLKEIAYLVQFRLAAEGQSLEEYLEWFFGEALLDYIIRAVDDKHAAKPLGLSLDPAAVTAIDGGFEPTKSVAKMYHRVRVENKRTRARRNFRLGDLYWDKANSRVVAVMTPDCDLVLRKGEKKEVRNAEHLLLVPGRISDLENTSASVGDFLMIGETPHNIQWNYKKLFTARFAGTLEKAGQSGGDFEYLGALRPLYAQEIQANLMNHVGRVGVAVPPVIGMPAIATIVLRTPSGVMEVSSQGTTTFNCSLVPGRASNQQSRVVFDREVIRRIRAALINAPADNLIAGSAEKLEALKQANGDPIESALRTGPEIGSDLNNGIFLATGKRDGTDAGPWCAIYISQVKIQPEAEGQPPPQGAAEADGVVLELATPAVGLVEPEAPVTANATGDVAQPAVKPDAMQIKSNSESAPPA